MSDQVFRLPDLGEGLTEAEVLDWRVKVGDTVTVDQIVVEVETAKAAVDVPVPFAGTVTRLHAEAGSAVAVGAPLITVGSAVVDSDEKLSYPGALVGPTQNGVGAGVEVGVAEAGSNAAEQYREQERAGSGNVLIGYGTGHGPGTGRRRRRPAAAADGNRAAADSAASAGPAAPRVISPLVRRLARDNGIDLAQVAPTGAGGVVRRLDIENRISHSAPAIATPAPAAATKGPLLHEQAAGEVVRIPLRGMRRAMAEKLTRSRAEIPDATTWVDVDATGLMQARDDLRAAGRSIGLLALLGRICVAGLRRFPDLNSTVDTIHDEIIQFPYVNLGFAAQTPRGLVVPVVRDAHRLTTAELAGKLAELTGRARDGELAPADLAGGTFTLNNYGVFGVDGSTPIINHPEAALLGVGRIVDKPWVVDGALAVRKVTQLSLTFDHRVCDGGVAGGFLRYVADCVERPAGLLADL